MGFWDIAKKAVTATATGGASLLKEGGGVGDQLFGGVHQAQAGDSQNFQYLGSPEEEQKYRAFLQQNAAAADGRGAYQMDRSGVDDALGGQQGALALDAGARASQADALNMYGAAARGEGPSVAAEQQRAGLEEATRSGRNMAASAVGANPLLAASNANAASADMARRSTAEAAALRAREIADARAGYAGVAGAMRGADQSRANAYLSGGDLSLRGEMGQAGLEQRQRELNDQRSMGYQNFVSQMNSDALAARSRYGAEQSAASRTNASNSVQRRAQNQQLTGDIIDMGGKAISGGGMP